VSLSFHDSDRYHREYDADRVDTDIGELALATENETLVQFVRKRIQKRERTRKKNRPTKPYIGNMEPEPMEGEETEDEILENMRALAFEESPEWKIRRDDGAAHRREGEDDTRPDTDDTRHRQTVSPRKRDDTTRKHTAMFRQAGDGPCPWPPGEAGTG